MTGSSRRRTEILVLTMAVRQRESIRAVAEVIEITVDTVERFFARFVGGDRCDDRNSISRSRQRVKWAAI